MSSYTDIGLVMIALTQIGSFILVWRKLSGAAETRTIAPQPLQVEASPEYMTRADCTRMHAETQRYEDAKFSGIEKRLADLTEAIERRNLEGESRAAKIHGRIDGVIETVSELRGQVNNHIHEHNRRVQ